MLCLFLISCWQQVVQSSLVVVISTLLEEQAVIDVERVGLTMETNACSQKLYLFTRQCLTCWSVPCSHCGSANGHTIITHPPPPDVKLKYPEWKICIGCSWFRVHNCEKNRQLCVDKFASMECSLHALKSGKVLYQRFISLCGHFLAFYFVKTTDIKHS